MLENIGLMRESVEALKAERGKLIKALNEIKGVEAFDSQGKLCAVQHRRSPLTKSTRKLLQTGHNAQEMGQNPASTRTASASPSACLK